MEQKFRGKVTAIDGIKVTVKLNGVKPNIGNILYSSIIGDIILEVYEYLSEDVCVCIILRGEGSLYMGIDVEDSGSALYANVSEKSLGRIYNALSYSFS